MKKILFTLLSIILLSSCQDPVIGPGFSDEDLNNTSQPNFQVDFDSQTFTASQVSTTFVGGVINITGFRGLNNEYVLLTINADSPGTYPLGFISPTVANAAAYGSENGAIPFIAAMAGSLEPFGQVIITEIDTVNKMLTGTFEFTGHQITVDASGNQVDNSKEFTNGKFTNIEYSDDLGGNNNTDNTFFAKVDGVEFQEDTIQANFVSLAGTTFISIGATKNSLENIGVNFPGDITSGTYNLSSFGDYKGVYNLSSTDINGANSGQITISSHEVSSKRITGTFQFTTTSLGSGSTASYEISEGEFDVTYQ